MTEAVAAATERSVSRAALVAAVPVALAGLLLAEGLLLPTAWLPFDEAAIAERARGWGGGVSGPLLPFLLSPFGHASAATMLVAGRVLGAACAAALFAPTYALARRAVGRAPACAAGALAVLVPAAVYAGALVPEALGTLLAACALWLEVRASERDSLPWLAGALALGVAAAVARPWFAAVPVALAAAYALPRVRRPRPLELAVGVAALYGLYYGLGGASSELSHAVANPWLVLRSALGSVGAAALGFGAAPPVLAAARLSSRPLPMALATGTPALAFAAGLSGQGHVDERPLVALAPLVFALAVGGAASRRRLAFSAAAIAATVLFIAWPGSKPALEQAPGLAFVRDLFGSTGAGPVLAAALVLACAGLALPRGRRSSFALAGAVLALVPGGELVAWSEAHHESTRLAADLPRPWDWVDRAAGGSARVSIVRTTSAQITPESLAELELWNRSLDGDVVVDLGAADRRTGALSTNAGPSEAFALGLELGGRPIAHGPLGTLYSVEPPLRLASSVTGVYPDGWSGADAVYRRFAGTGPSTVRVTISRKAWGGTDVPGHVSVVSSPLGGAATARRETVIHAAKEVVLAIPVPSPPFEVDVHVEPTFSPAKLGGGGDTRQLGAQLDFAYLG